MPDVAIQSHRTSRLVARADRCGRQRSGGAFRQRRSHLSRAPVPLATPGAKTPAARGLRADRAAVRARQPHRQRVDRTGRDGRDHAEVLVLHPQERLRTEDPPVDPPRARLRCDRAGPRGQAPEARRADRAVRRDQARGARELRAAADELREELAGETVTFVVTATSTSPRLHGWLRVLRIRPGQAFTRRIRAQQGGVPRASGGGRGLRRDGAVHPVRYTSGLEPRGLSRLASARQAGRSWAAPACVQPDGDLPYVRHLRAGTERGFREAGRRGPGLDSRNRGRGAARRCPRAHLAQQAAGCALGPDRRSISPRRASLHCDRHVRPHRGALGAG